MAVLGTVVLVFLVTHMQNFWWRMHFDQAMPTQTVNGAELKDLHTVVMAFFDPATNGMASAAVGLYVLGMLALGFHLWHGFWRMVVDVFSQRTVSRRDRAAAIGRVRPDRDRYRSAESAHLPPAALLRGRPSPECNPRTAHPARERGN